MEREHTLRWLDRTVDDRTNQALSQIQEEWDSHHYPEALRLCEQLIARAQDLQQHANQGLAYCHLGETYRLMGIHHYQDAVEAFGRARVHFSLDGTSASRRNRGIAYWSLAMVLEALPGHWNNALRFYHSALDIIEGEIKEVQSQSAPPRADRSRLIQELDDIRKLITEDQENLLRQQTMGDPKIVGLMRQMVAAENRFRQAEERMQEMVDRAEKAAVAATKATQHAYFAARAAQAVQSATDSASRQALHAARHVDQAVNLLDKSTRRLQTAIRRIEAVDSQRVDDLDTASPAVKPSEQGRREEKET